MECHLWYKSMIVLIHFQILQQFSNMQNIRYCSIPQTDQWNAHHILCIENNSTVPSSARVRSESKHSLGKLSSPKIPYPCTPSPTWNLVAPKSFHAHSSRKGPTGESIRIPKPRPYPLPGFCVLFPGFPMIVPFVPTSVP